MNFTDLCAEVYKVTKRPDRVAETESAVKAATLKCHQVDYFAKDLLEVGINFGAAAFVQQFEYRQVIPLFRAGKYLRKYDAVNQTPGDMLDLVLPEQIFSRYGVQKQDIYYLAGAFYQINSSTQEQYYLFGCYVHPDISSVNFNSWIAIEHPYAIIWRAAGTVFKAIGKDEEAAANKMLSDEEVALIKLSNVTNEGF